VNFCKRIDSCLSVRPRGRARISGLCFAFTLAFATAPAPVVCAATPSADVAAEARRSEAKRLFDAGVQAFAEHRYADAVAAFLQADAVVPSPPLSFNIARAFEHLDEPSKALGFYRDYLRREPAAKNAAQVQARVGELALVLAARGVQQLTVLSTPTGASVTIDRHVLGKTPLTTELTPGAHHVRLELRGYGPTDANVELAAREPRDLAFSLEPVPTAADTPLAAPSAGEAAPRTGHPRGASPLRYGPWLMLGAGAASLLGALGFELARRSAESSARHSTQPDYPEHFEAMESRKTTARVLGSVGGALLATGGLWLLFRTQPRSGTAVGMACDPSGCRLATVGSFR